MRKQCFIAVGAIYVLFLSNVAIGESLAEEPIVAAAASNSSDELVHRIKRFLIFNNGGLVKNVLGILIPVQFGDDSKRSLNLGYNFQSQYLVPPLPISIFSAPFFTGHVRSSRMLQSSSDETRQLVYDALESTWDNWGRNGRECLRRAICEVAESPFAPAGGLFTEIVDTIFTPHSNDVDQDIYDSRLAGLNHADCQKTFSQCPPGEGFLDSISHFLGEHSLRRFNA